MEIGIALRLRDLEITPLRADLVLQNADLVLQLFHPSEPLPVGSPRALSRCGRLVLGTAVLAWGRARGGGSFFGEYLRKRRQVPYLNHDRIYKTDQTVLKLY